MWGLSSRTLENERLISRLLLTLLIYGYVQESNEVGNGSDFPFHKYRVRNDPNQVKPDKVTASNLFGWLNLKNSVRFRLWTRENPDLAHEIKYNDLESLRTSNFNPRRITKIIIHGFVDSATEAGVTYYLFDMRDAYLHLGDVNVFIIDYSLFTMPIFYYTALPDIAAVRLGEFINFLSKNSELRLGSVHLIGFSLGAHVAGKAGKQLNGRIGRITGLDPAGPTFHHLSNEYRLDRGDAQFVDIIHTNGGKEFIGGAFLGISEALGHVDFYPNGGSRQPGCKKPNLLNFSYKTLECSHGRAARYYIESITSPLSFPACRCESLQKYKNRDCSCDKYKLEEKIYMGEHLTQSIRGIFQLVTRSEKPFGIGPLMDVSLPNVTLELTKRERRRSWKGSQMVERFVPNERQTEAAIQFQTVRVSVKYNNTFNAIDFPNNDIIQMCQTFLRNL